MLLELKELAKSKLSETSTEIRIEEVKTSVEVMFKFIAGIAFLICSFRVDIVEFVLAT